MTGPGEPGPRHHRLSRCVYRLLLALYPSRFRARFEDSLRQDFADLLAGECGRGGPLRGLVRAWARAVPDLLSSALRQRLGGVAPGERGVLGDDRAAVAVRARRLGLSVALDVQQAARALRRRPWPTLLAALLLALGIGPGVAIFSVVNGVVLQPLPYPDSSRIVHLTRRLESGRTAMLSLPALRRLEEGIGALGAIAPLATPAVTMRLGGRPRSVTGGYTTAALTAVLGVEPMLGSWLPEDAGEEAVVVLSHELWSASFASDPAILGTRIEIAGQERRVLGVMPPGFARELRARLWLPPPSRYRDSEFGVFAGIARIRPDAGLAALRAELAAVGGAAVDPDDPAAGGVQVATLHDIVTGRVRTALLLLLGAVAVLLLVACANVANLLLVRIAGRRREIATRAALGAGRARIARQLVLEAVLLSVLGGILGLVATGYALDALLAWIPTEIPRLSEVRLDAPVLAVACLATLVPGLFIGVMQLGALRRGGPFAVLRTVGGGTGGPGQPRLRRVLSVAQMALTVLLLVGAGLFARSFVHLVRVDLGFKTAATLDLEVRLDGRRYDSEAELAATFDGLLEEVRAVPGVDSVVYAGGVMPRGSTWRVAPISESEEETDQEMTRIAVSPGYFRQMGIPRLEGRGFSDADRADSTPVVIVSEASARLLWPGGEAVGKRLRLDPESPWMDVVGVVGTVRQDGPRRSVIPQLYVPLRQAPQSWGHILVATHGDATDLAEAVRAAIWRRVPEVPLDRVATLEQILGDETAEQRFQMTLLAAYATTALLLAAVGLAGMLGYAVTTRRREIGVRVALGASEGSIRRRILTDGLVTVLQGTALGVVAALGAGRLAGGLLYAVPVWDPWTYGAAVVGSCIVGLLAAWLPARRASRIDPVQSLRAE